MPSSRGKARRAVISITDGSGELLAALADPQLLLWSIYILLFPIYVAPSGLPQPGEAVAIILTFFVYARWDGKLGPASRSATRALGYFIGYATLVNIAWSLLEGSFAISLKHGFLMSPLFYLYNALILVLALMMFRRYGERFLWITVKMVLLTVLVQVMLSFVIGGGGARSKLLFNNPNQLGYYAVLSASLLFFGQVRGWLSTMQAVVGTAACVYLGLLSASKASLACLALVILFGVVQRMRTVLLFGIVILLFMAVIEPQTGIVERAVFRVQNDETAGFVEERGYDRITHFPQYWLLGSGEGGYARFRGIGKIGSHELHSSAGTLFFCYGVVGSALFLAFGWSIVRGAGVRATLLLAPAAAYGLSHQGLRFTLLWVLFACIVAHKETRKLARAGPRR